MPIINIKFIENVVATTEQKHQLVREMTNTFVSTLGEVVRPFTYVVIEETKMYDWGIAGQPMPDLVWLTGPEYAQIMGKSQDIMRAVVEQTQEQQPAVASASPASE
jgi:4-oxalocrotonate tautomerase